MVILPGDILVVSGLITDSNLASLGLVEDSTSATAQNDFSDAEPMAEVMITPHSNLIGKNICDIDMRNRFGLNVLGIWRHGEPVTQSFTRLNLQFGDALLVQGPAIKVDLLNRNQDMMLLEEDPDTIFRPSKIGSGNWHNPGDT